MTLDFYNFFIATGTIVMQIGFAVILLGMLLKSSWTNWIGKNANWLLLALFGTSLIGSLIYEHVFLFEPCMLCWYQRMFMLPSVILLIRGIVNKTSAVKEVLLFSFVGGAIAIYHNFIDLFPNSGVEVCTNAAISCTLRYVWEFGYITIPMMSLTVFALASVIGILGRKSEKSTEVRLQA